MNNGKFHPPTDRSGITRKASACGMEFYVTCSFAGPDPFEVFIKIAKGGSEIAGIYKALAFTISTALQHGAPWDSLSDRYRGQRFGEGDASNPSLLHAIATTVDNMRDEWRSKFQESSLARIPRPPAAGHRKP